MLRKNRPDSPFRILQHEPWPSHGFFGQADVVGWPFQAMCEAVKGETSET